VQITLPFFGDLLGFIGALGTGPTTFFLPPLMWLCLKKSRWRLSSVLSSQPARFFRNNTAVPTVFTSSATL
jgi:hypothetical protein